MTKSATKDRRPFSKADSFSKQAAFILNEFVLISQERMVVSTNQRYTYNQHKEDFSRCEYELSTM